MLLFDCLYNLTKKFKVDISAKNSEDKIFPSEYFECLNSFLTGVNKINPSNEEEITMFNNILEPIVNFIKNPGKFKYYQKLVSLMENYIKFFDRIEELSALILNNLKLILEEDKTTIK
jgi:hypothetical protein